jgi:hypothetical protein
VPKDEPVTVASAFSFRNKYKEGSVWLTLALSQQLKLVSKQKYSLGVVMGSKAAEIGHLGAMSLLDCELKCFLLATGLAQHEAVRELAFGAEEFVEIIEESIDQEIPLKEYKSGINHEKEGILRLV